MADLTIQPVAGNSITGSPQKIGKGTETGFGDILRKSVEAVDASIHEADELQAGLLSGAHSNIHETMIAMEKAGITFRMLTRVHGKVISAYQEVMRMQL